jgi:hypothetical protein
MDAIMSIYCLVCWNPERSSRESGTLPSLHLDVNLPGVDWNKLFRCFFHNIVTFWRTMRLLGLERFNMLSL